MSSVFSGTNTYVPSHEASQKLVVDFSQKPDKFPINEWAALVKVTNDTGYYLRMDIESVGRFEDDDPDLNKYVWADGQPAPNGDWDNEAHNFLKFACQRRAYAFTIGQMAEKQATWPILAQNAGRKAQKAMIARTLLAIKKATDTTQYDTSHVKSATSWGGGLLDAGSSTTPYLKLALSSMAQSIMDDTLNGVDDEDLILVMGPAAARKIAASPEVQDYMKGSVHSLAVIKGDKVVNAKFKNARYGLPDELYGYKVVVENSRKVNSKKGATRNVVQAWPSTMVAMFARPGSLASVAGGPNFSTVQIFSFEEMTVESKYDVDNRRTVGRVVENFGVEVVAPVSGCLATSAVTP
jgi:hypothetical protein